MTDFFTRAANKAIGVAPAIQPVIASRYAPARFAHEAVEFELEVEGDQISDDSRRNRRSAKSEAEPSTVRDNFPPHEVETIAAAPLAGDLVPTQVSEIRPSGSSEKALLLTGQAASEPIQPTTATPVVREASHASLSREQPTARHASTELLKSPSRIAPPAAPVNGVVANNPQAQPQRSSERTLAQSQEASLDEHTGFVSEGNEKRPVEHEPGQLSTPSLNHYASARSNSIGERHPQIPESTFIVPADKVEERSPIIRVTIGRIDVRAVTPPPPIAQAAKPPALKVSLDEFLKQHNGRQR